MNYDKLADQTVKQLNLEGQTLNVDLEAVIKTAFQIFIDKKTEEVQDRLEKYEGKRYIDFGKLKLLEEMQEWANRYCY